MRSYLLLGFSSILVLLGAACTAKQEQPAAQQDPEYRPTATIKEIMDSLVDPGADYVWNSVETTFTEKGADEKAPRTDEEWQEVRRHAMMVIEATNLLLIPGRHTANPGEKAEEPKVELSPEQIDVAIAQDRPAFVKLAHGLHDAAMQSLKAIDKKDAEMLLNTGDGIDKACENCHLKYWYPNDKNYGQ